MVVSESSLVATADTAEEEKCPHHIEFDGRH
jgi:hypothetical protein